MAAVQAFPALSASHGAAAHAVAPFYCIKTVEAAGMAAAKEGKKHENVSTHYRRSPG